MHQIHREVDRVDPLPQVLVVGQLVGCLLGEI